MIHTNGELPVDAKDAYCRAQTKEVKLQEYCKNSDWKNYRTIFCNICYKAFKTRLIKTMINRGKSSLFEK